MNNNWAINDIYKDINHFNYDYNLVNDLIKDIQKYNNNIKNKNDLLLCLKLNDKISIILNKLSVYSEMLYSINIQDNEANNIKNTILDLSTKYETNILFLATQLKKTPKKTIQKYINDVDFCDYKYKLKLLLKIKKHLLNEKEEKIISECCNIFYCFNDIFNKIDNVDLKLNDFTYKKQTYCLTHGLYHIYMQNEDQKFRQIAFKTYYNAYINNINTIYATYYGNIKSDVLLTKLRKYSSCMEHTLNEEDIHKNVYNNLINNVNNNLDILHTYLKQKKQLLHINNMHMYDIYAPIINIKNITYKYEDALNIILNALQCLGDDYLNIVKKAFNNNWIDVYEKPNKMSGAYSISCYDVHPFILLNYNCTMHDMFTIAHEIGHSIHSYYSNQYMPYPKSRYTIFLAEIASTVNELLLLHYLLNNNNNTKEMQKFLLSYFMEIIRTTLFRQTQFAEFENIIHDKFFNNEILSVEDVNNIYYELNNKYYNPKIINNDVEIKYEWARIPHFYNSFYVYKYATGIISALLISENIIKNKDNYVSKYIKFLSSGCSDSSENLLKIININLKNQKSFNKAFKIIKKYLNQFIKIQ